MSATKTRPERRATEAPPERRYELTALQRAHLLATSQQVERLQRESYALQREALALVAGEHGATAADQPSLETGATGLELVLRPADTA